MTYNSGGQSNHDDGHHALKALQVLDGDRFFISPKKLDEELVKSLMAEIRTASLSRL